MDKVRLGETSQSICGRPPRRKSEFQTFSQVVGCCHLSDLLCGGVPPLACMGVRGSSPNQLKCA